MMDFSHGNEPVLVDTDVAGVYGTSEIFEVVLLALDHLLTDLRGPGYQAFRFPPVISRGSLDRSGYFRNFPHLLGGVWSFTEEADLGRRLLDSPDPSAVWESASAPTELMLAPSACFHVYPHLARRHGQTPLQSQRIDTCCYCFRREPSSDPGRLQTFRMREFVFVGEPAAAQEFLADYRPRLIGAFRDLGLEPRLEQAHDPFFRGTRSYLAQSQLERGTKQELRCALGGAQDAAVASFNAHGPHFGAAWGLSLHGGAVAHSACLGVGLERLTLALFHAHGPEVAAWPADIRSRLCIAAGTKSHELALQPRPAGA